MPYQESQNTMTVIKCKMCGGSLSIDENTPIGICAYCGTYQTLPNSDQTEQTISQPKATSLFQLFQSTVDTSKNNIFNGLKPPPDPTLSSLSQRGAMALEDGCFDQAYTFFERALDLQPTEGFAHFGKFLAKNQVRSIEAFKTSVINYEDDIDFQRAQQFADSKLATILIAALEINSKNRKEQELLEKEQAERVAAQKRYKELCAQLEKELQEELIAAKADIVSRNNSELELIRKKIEVAKFEAQKEKVALQQEIAKLEREQRSLGFFNSHKKKDLDSAIATCKQRINDQDELIAQLRKKNEPVVKAILKKQNEELRQCEADVRAKYSFPDPPQIS